MKMLIYDRYGDEPVAVFEGTREQCFRQAKLAGYVGKHWRKEWV